MQRVELISPAGGIDKLRVAYRYGADAVYLGGKSFNLRAKSSNFSFAELEKAVSYAHSQHKKVFITLNILAHDRELRPLPNFIRKLDELKVDAVIVADLGVLELVRENSQLPVHVSTQASVTNWRSARMWQKLGAKRCVLARELSLTEIRKIKNQVPELELEVFVHGAMCMTYSGRCNLSSYFSERDGNRGVCSNTCRWKYHLVEEKRPNEYYLVYEDDTGSYIYNSKDLCTIEFIDKILDAGVTGLKIEGRMKSLLYCALTTKIYRAAVDSYMSGNFKFNPAWLQQLQTFSHRGYTAGFYHGKLDGDFQNRNGGYTSTHKYVGFVQEQAEQHTYHAAIHEKISIGDELEIICPDDPNPKTFTLEEMRDLRADNALTTAQPNMQVALKIPFPCAEYDLLRIASTSCS